MTKLAFTTNSPKHATHTFGNPVFEGKLPRRATIEGITIDGEAFEFSDPDIIIAINRYSQVTRRSRKMTNNCFTLTAVIQGIELDRKTHPCTYFEPLGSSPVFEHLENHSGALLLTEGLEVKSQSHDTH